jgi:hypothetical protein
MYGCSIPVLIYGWIENNSELMLHPEWIETNYPFISYYASETVRNHMYSACYGIECKLNNEGHIEINSDHKQAVQKFYNLWCKYQENNNNNLKNKNKNKIINKMPMLGYRLAITGDFEWQHKYYIIDSHF